MTKPKGGWFNFDTGKYDYHSDIPTDLRPYIRNDIPAARNLYDLYLKTGKSQVEAFILVSTPKGTV